MYILILQNVKCNSLKKKISKIFFRDYVVAKGKDVLVYTGSHGVMELDDFEGKKVSINLNLETPEVARLPAPRYVNDN